MPFLSFRVFNCCFNLRSVFSGPQLLADATPQPSPALNFWRPPGGRRWNSRWPARSARSAASRRPPKPPKRPHCHLTRFLSWLCVRCAQQPRKFVWRLRIDADIKKNLHTNKTLFEPTFRIKKANYYYQEWIKKRKKCQSKTGWLMKYSELKSSKFESPIQP